MHHSCLESRFLPCFVIVLSKSCHQLILLRARYDEATFYSTGHNRDWRRFNSHLQVSSEYSLESIRNSSTIEVSSYKARTFAL